VPCSRAERDPAYGDDFARRCAAKSVVSVTTVRQLVAQVVEGVADASIIYVTDATPDVRPHLSAFEIPSYLNVTADYSIACVGTNVRQVDSMAG
jgi:molybdate transport system substrate-binding protein